MKDLLKPRNVLFYFLSAIVLFFLGMIFAGLAGAGKGQGLAAAGIVFGYGVMAGFVAFIAAIFVAQVLRENRIILLNKIFIAIILLLLVILAYRFQSRQAASNQTITPKFAKVMQPTAPANSQIRPNNQYQPLMGLGMVRPKFFENEVLYFYGNPNLEKPVSDHLPTDSLVFQRTELGIEITYAPPWFVPAHLKMDYEILFLRLLSFNSEFIEVVVNETNGQTAFMDRLKNDLRFWPEFLLSINSVEPLDRQNNPLRIKPLSNASLVKAEYAFLRPLRITNQWMHVEILDDGFKSQGKGWIKWREDGKLLIEYSLLS